MKETILSMLLFVTIQSNAQLINNGGSIFIDTGAVVTVDNTLKGTDWAEIYNKGELYVSGDIINNATPSFFRQQGATGSLILNGGDQLIDGSNGFSVYTMILDNDHVKTARINLVINHHLALRNSILNADNKNITITNNSTDAISRGTGFVATQQNAQLIRNTQNGQAAYLFPTGSLTHLYYQPVHLLTNGNDQGVFGMTLHDYSATPAGFDIASKDDSIDRVNDQYYYTIDRLSGQDSASLVFYSDTTKEPSYKEVGIWSSPESKWTIPYASVVEPGTFDTYLNRSFTIAHPDFIERQYTLVKKWMPETPTISKKIQVPNSFTPNSDGLNDFWEIKGIEKFTDNHVVIYNRWGEIVFETRSYSNTNHFDASNVMQGVYVYIVEVKDNTGYSKTYNGDLTILR